MTEIRNPLWLFDGDCGPSGPSCGDDPGVAPPADVHPYQSADLDALGIGQDEVLRGPVLVRPDGSHVVGPQSFAELLRNIPRPPFPAGRRAHASPGSAGAWQAMGRTCTSSGCRATATCRTPSPCPPHAKPSRPRSRLPPESRLSPRADVLGVPMAAKARQSPAARYAHPSGVLARREGAQLAAAGETERLVSDPVVPGTPGCLREPVGRGVDGAESRRRRPPPVRR